MSAWFHSKGFNFYSHHNFLILLWFSSLHTLFGCDSLLSFSVSIAALFVSDTFIAFGLFAAGVALLLGVYLGCCSLDQSLRGGLFSNFFRRGLLVEYELRGFSVGSDCFDDLCGNFGSDNLFTSCFADFYLLLAGRVTCYFFIYSLLRASFYLGKARFY